MGILACISMEGGGSHKAPPSKSPKLKMIYQWNFPHRTMYTLPPLFACLRFWFVICDVTMPWFLWRLPANYAIYRYNSTWLPKIIWNFLHWCNLCILSIVSHSLLHLKQKNSKEPINSTFVGRIGTMIR